MTIDSATSPTQLVKPNEKPSYVYVLAWLGVEDR